VGGGRGVLVKRMVGGKGVWGRVGGGGSGVLSAWRKRGKGSGQGGTVGAVGRDLVLGGWGGWDKQKRIEEGLAAASMWWWGVEKGMGGGVGTGCWW